MYFCIYMYVCLLGRVVLKEPQEPVHGLIESVKYPGIIVFSWKHAKCMPPPKPAVSITIV